MRTFIRRLHLYTGLCLLVFVLMYFVSGWIMVHEGWFHRGEPASESRTESLQLDGGLSDAALAEQLQARFGLRGKRQPPNRRGDGSRQFNFVRPGTTFEAVVAAESGQVKITRKEFGRVGLAHGLHRLHGYGGGAVYSVWALCYDLASAALIVFALSGVILWLQTTPRRLPGLICLGLGAAATAGMILHFLLHL